MSFISDVVRGQGLESVDGILFDLGVCSAHFDDPERGLEAARGKRDTDDIRIEILDDAV